MMFRNTRLPPIGEEYDRLLIGNRAPSSKRVSNPCKDCHTVGFMAKVVVFGGVIASITYMWYSGSSLLAHVGTSTVSSSSISLQNPCRTARNETGPVHPPDDYQNIPGSLEMFVENRVVCPNQTQDDLQSGNIVSVSPDVWERHRKRQTGWEGNGHGRGLIVFKRGGSGSTWFDTLINSHPKFDYRHEADRNLFKRGDKKELATDKMRKFLQGGGTCKSKAGYCGFSISPSKHANFVDWSKLIRDTGATLIVFVRTNSIKRDLGLKKKIMLSKLPQRCKNGSSYKPGMEDDSQCVLSESVEIKTDNNSTNKNCFMSSWDLLDTALDSGVAFQILTYEGMQQNLTSTFDRLGVFSGWPLRSFDWSSNVKTAKVSSEDLQTSISNYAELEELFKEKTCYLNMLHSKAQQISPLCNCLV